MKIPSVVMTGNICSGKSLCGRFFSGEGIKVIDADEIVQTNLQKGFFIYKAYVEIFGDAILSFDGSIERDKVRQILFSDKEIKRKVEAIVHPFVLYEILHKVNSFKNSHKTLCVIPLVFEIDIDVFYDRIILIYCKDSIRLQRLIKRNKLDPDIAKIILCNQMEQRTKIFFSDYIIDNSYEIEYTQIQLSRLLGGLRHDNF